MESLTSLEEIVRPEWTALILLDLQNDFCGDQRRQAMLPYARGTLEAAREAGVTVVHIQNTVLPGGRSDSSADLARRARLGLKTAATIEGTEGHRFVDEVAPNAGEPVVRKHRASAFTNTTLETLLRSMGIRTIVLAGTATQGSVLATALAGIARNYYVVVVRDAVESFREDLHQAAMLLLENTVNDVTDSGTLRRVWVDRPARA